MLALCIVLDTLSVVKFGRVSPAQLLKAVKAHLSAYLEAYNENGWLPKHHYALHLPVQLRRFSFLIGL